MSALPPPAAGLPSPGRIQLFPAGRFAARDGRPGCLEGVAVKEWRLGPYDMAKVIERWKSRKTPLVVDYEHQTHLAAQNGQPAPAAGWVTGLSASPEGLFATVEWTEKARGFIRAGEYRYISPTFSFDRKTGAVLEIHSAALTNAPALDGMDKASAKTSYSYEDANMDRLLTLLCTLLGVPKLENADAAAEALARQLPQQNLAALLQAKDAAIASARAELESAKNAAPDPARYVAMATFQAVQQEAAALRAKVAEMESAKAISELAGEIEAALKDGRLAASAKSWAESLAKSNPEALREFLKTAPPVEALKGTQTAGRTPPDSGAASLTAEEEYACAQLGLSREDYIKAKEGK